jgi:hypothetical protein
VNRGLFAGTLARLAIAGLGVTSCGREEPPPVVPDGELLTDGQPATHSLALLEGRLYWGASPRLGDGDGAIRSMPVTGGGVETLATIPSLQSIFDIALDASDLYACVETSSGEEAIYRVPVRGGNAERIVDFGSDFVGCTDVALDAEAVYWTDFSETAGRVVRTVRDGGDEEVLAGEQLRPGALAIDETHVYWINRTDESGGGVFRILKEGGVPELLAAPSQDPRPLGTNLEVDESHVYTVASRWVDRPGHVMRIPKIGGNVELLADDDHRLHGIALDDRHIYWTRSEGNPWEPVDGSDLVVGGIARVSKEGGEVEVLADHQNGPQAVVVDDDWVYWANSVSGTIRRIAKPEP